MAQPAWKTRMESAQQASQQLDTVFEEDRDTTNAATNTWPPPDGYQSSTSTQQAGDAAKDAQDDVELSDSDWVEYWRVQTEDLYGASFDEHRLTPFTRTTRSLGDFAIKTVASLWQQQKRGTNPSHSTTFRLQFFLLGKSNGAMRRSVMCIYIYRDIHISIYI